MTKKTVLGILIALALSVGYARPTLTSALTSDDIQAQIQMLVTQIQNLTAQLTTLRLQTPTFATFSTSSSTPSYNCSVVNRLNRTLSFGMRGDDVVGVQTFLKNTGYFNGAASGYFGPVTANAVTQWQVSQGITGVGSIGPTSRERIRIWCGNPTPTPVPAQFCKPITYMPIACSDGSSAQATHDQSGCLTSYQCPVINFVPPSSCKSWNDGCNICTRSSPGGSAMCTMRACLVSNTNSIWAGKGYCSAYFDSSSNNLPPVISGISGPTTLGLNAMGTWVINASDPENGQLTYSIQWGDENRINYPMMSASASNDAFMQTGTFMHSYSSPGTYTITVVVRDAAGQTSQSSITVSVASSSIVCTTEYVPVCGQPPEPACRRAVPACMIATSGPRTYSNNCELMAAGATSISSGTCSNGF